MAHSFHIPVMGTSYTIDTPIKVAHLGIDSVISLSDDVLMEKLRKMYCKWFEMPYAEISSNTDHSRSKRITAYLDTIHSIATRKFESLCNSIHESKEEIKKYMSLLPDTSSLKQRLYAYLSVPSSDAEVQKKISDALIMGRIGVNIMTKVDRENYRHGKVLPIEYNDAHAALLGFANSRLHGPVIFSAGLNPRLYNFIETLPGFIPDENGYVAKQIVLKVSDYRSAWIQGKYLAKKGLWVSAFKIESGLNCGGHAFATDGFLMGPILHELFKKKDELQKEMYALYKAALIKKGIPLPEKNPTFRLMAQGGVGTADEHQLLLNHYHLSSVGWGSPFLLVPEATTVDRDTIHKLAAAGPDDLYLSYISPLGIPFNNLRGNTKDIEKQERIDAGNPGSKCPRKYLAFDKTYDDKGICSASTKYQHIKIQELNDKSLSVEDYQKAYHNITEKACICTGLSVSALLHYHLNHRIEGNGVTVCPGPNIQWFTREASLEEMTGHIYGRNNLINDSNRPHMFINELALYVRYLKENIVVKCNADEIDAKYVHSFIDNLNQGIQYYHDLYVELSNTEHALPVEFPLQLDNYSNLIKQVQSDISA